jgi:hypothetical protein
MKPKEKFMRIRKWEQGLGNRMILECVGEIGNF